jgi:Divergent InlB B-repeat domain
VTRGVAGGGAADNGADAGGAVFSFDNVLEIIDSTFSANQSTGSGAAIVVYSDEGDGGAPVDFILSNSILANNGANECFFTGGSVIAQGVGNLIMNNASGLFVPSIGTFNGCPGVVTKDDPLLGLLQVNAPSSIPTMAITSASSAFNTADTGTSLAADQRGVDRPQGGKPDIGAFEVCVESDPKLPFGCAALTVKPPPPSTSLTVKASIAAGGTISPAPGTYTVPLNTVTILTATPNLGFCFQSWSGNVTSPTSASTTVIMDQAQGVTANFVQCDFSISPIAPITIPLASSATTNVVVKSLGTFSSPVSLSVTGQPSGVTAFVNPTTVTPTAGAAPVSVLTIAISPAVTPQTFLLNVNGISGALTHSVPVTVTVMATNASTANVITALQNAQCISPVSVAKILKDELALAQVFVNGKHKQLAIDTYGAMLLELQLLTAKKLIPANCTIGGVTFSPATVLIADVRDLMGNLKAGTIASPITGYVVNANGLGVPNATVTLLDSANAVVAAAKTDVTGFYFFATTGVLTPGSNYTARVTLFPPHLTVSSPASQPFIWAATAFELANFVLN